LKAGVGEEAARLRLIRSSNDLRVRISVIN